MSRLFQRNVGLRNYKKLFILATEGAKTEKSYFEILRQLFQDEFSCMCMHYVPSDTSSDPASVVRRIKKFMEKFSSFSPKKDEVWIVADVDNWTKSQFQHYLDWVKQNSYAYMAISNPCFECWLLFHFDENFSIPTNSSKAEESLKQILKKKNKTYNKEVDTTLISRDSIKRALDRARNLYKEADGKSIPEKEGQTAVWLLVQHIFQTSHV